LTGSRVRESALDILYAYDCRDAYLDLLLTSYLSRSAFDRRDRALLTDIVKGTVRMKASLDFKLGLLSSRGLEEVDPPLLWLLRIAGYQLDYLRVPAHAACNTAVDIARRRFGKAGASFVNAILRAYASASGEFRYPESAEDPGGYLEARYSHPRWIAEMWIRELGLKKAESICATDNLKRDLCLRCNLARTGRESIIMALEKRGARARHGDLVPESVLVRGTGALSDSPEFQSGMFSVQDEGAMLVSRVVSPEAGMKVLDMCSGPGGKCNHIAELMGNDGLVMALDANERRTRMVMESAVRLGNTAVKPRTMDARRAGGELDMRFDRVLVDAPCSGLGILYRHPDIRWRRRPKDIGPLVELQGVLLDAGASLVKPGGLLVYSTCTISDAENAGVVEDFLNRQRAVRPARPAGFESERRAGITLYPDTQGCDGTFIAVFEKIES
jgi:16S rRNA (cytosine967-C5)-methyltransferase